MLFIVLNGYCPLYFPTETSDALHFSLQNVCCKIYTSEFSAWIAAVEPNVFNSLAFR